MFVFLWLTSLSLMISESIHITASGIISFFFMAEHYSSVHLYRICIQSSAGGHLGCFHVLAVVNSAALNAGEEAS